MKKSEIDSDKIFKLENIMAQQFSQEQIKQKLNDFKLKNGYLMNHTEKQKPQQDNLINQQEFKSILKVQQKLAEAKIMNKIRKIMNSPEQKQIRLQEEWEKEYSNFLQQQKEFNKLQNSQGGEQSQFMPFFTNNNIIQNPFDQLI
ncbi:hypothetical protein PPERSA_03330 [Pseudocohnilembus persalinus]|uniref:Uncharacterized protein n=1 Tax=Pseudocohnilembus persalinus TaxID=266149 RepID=A0A0V0Q8C3_PSEPJ|nr:hypothetical protein PPERSA_03330 [Pseudocohnilembus persalinus]|eukprot:KRW98499.1 hypothetical protein PPERSA_03330 [Pseudocohnilembus persalinus]